MAEIPPEGLALLETIAGTESAGSYNVIYGGQTFESYADHPHVQVPITSGPNKGKTSSAAGKYQFLGYKWEEAKKALNLPDFSPASQDQAAWWLAQKDYKAATNGGNLLSALRSRDPVRLAGVGKALSGTWTSLPHGIEAGTNTSKFVKAYSSVLPKFHPETVRLQDIHDKRDKALEPAPPLPRARPGNAPSGRGPIPPLPIPAPLDTSKVPGGTVLGGKGAVPTGRATPVKSTVLTPNISRTIQAKDVTPNVQPTGPTGPRRAASREAVVTPQPGVIRTAGAPAGSVALPPGFVPPGAKAAMDQAKATTVLTTPRLAQIPGMFAPATAGNAVGIAATKAWDGAAAAKSTVIAKDVTPPQSPPTGPTRGRGGAEASRQTLATAQAKAAAAREAAQAAASGAAIERAAAAKERAESARAAHLAAAQAQVQARADFGSIAPTPAGAIYRINGHVYNVNDVLPMGDKLFQVTATGFRKVYDPAVIGAGHNLFGSMINGGITQAQARLKAGRPAVVPARAVSAPSAPAPTSPSPSGTGGPMGRGDTIDPRGYGNDIWDSTKGIGGF